MGDDDDEFQNWDARARWQFENNESLEVKSIYNENLVNQDKILELLTFGPRTAHEIALQIGSTTPKVVKLISNLRMLGCKIHSDKRRSGGSTCYTLIERPKNLRHMPKIKKNSPSH